MSVEAVVSLGVKGSDVVLSTYKKLAKEKKEFEKPAKSKVETKHGGRSSDEAHPGGGTTGQEVSQGADRKRRNEQQTVNNSEKAAKSSKLMASAMERTAQSFSGLNPVEFIRSAAASTVQLTAGLAGGAANAAWTGSGEVVRAIIEHAGKLVDMGVQAAAGALSSYKNALPQATRMESERGLTKAAGLTTMSRWKTVTGSEAAQLSAMLLPTVGKVGKELNKELEKLYGGASGRTVQRQQANALAQGDFSVLGTTKGWLLNKISQGLGDVPPEVAQKFRASLLSQVDKKEMATEKAWVRAEAKRFEDSDYSTQENIVNAGIANHSALKSANNNLNQLQVNMIKSVSGLNSVLSKAASQVSSVLGSLQSDINKATEQAGQKGRRGRHN